MVGLKDAGAVREAAPEAFTPVLREGVLRIPGDFPLHFGGRLQDVQVAWRIAGAVDGPLVVALGGISSGRYVANDEQRRGWWHAIVGPGQAIDTRRCQVLGIDFLGGSGETTGPQRGDNQFPAISAYDQAAMLHALLEHLGVPTVRAIVGASYGGMVALAFAERWPRGAEHIVVISAADRSHPLSTAWRSVQRAIVRYALTMNDGPEGLRLARALAMATYRSAEEFATRFAGEPRRLESGRFEFPVESYLLARGDAYAQSYVPEAFVCLSESIDLHQVDPVRIRVPATLVAIKEDQLVPIGDMRSLAARLGEHGELVELSSLYGHDAFLKEGDALQPVLAKALRLPTGT